MTPPLIINNFGDVTVLDTLDISSSLEACDVIDGEYVAYDTSVFADMRGLALSHARLLG